MRSIFVGDVHGCLEELDELVASLAPAPFDRFFFVGDLVDRGPDSVGVIRRVRELLTRFPGSACVAGNHEEKQLRNHERGTPGGAWTLDATDEDWGFLDGLPLVVRVPEAKAIVVHGGFFPRFFENHPEIGDPGVGWRRAKGKLAERRKRFLRVRTVDEAGNMVALGSERPGVVHWSSRYDGREGFCFFGHDPQLSPPRPLRGAHALGIDTGCCFGGELTAAVVSRDTAAGEATFVSVKARERYAEPRFAVMEE